MNADATMHIPYLKRPPGRLVRLPSDEWLEKIFKGINLMIMLDPPDREVYMATLQVHKDEETTGGKFARAMLTIAEAMG